MLVLTITCRSDISEVELANALLPPHQTLTTYLALHKMEIADPALRYEVLLAIGTCPRDVLREQALDEWFIVSELLPVPRHNDHHTRPSPAHVTPSKDTHTGRFSASSVGLLRLTKV